MLPVVDPAVPVTATPEGWHDGLLPGTATCELEGPSGRARLTLTWPVGAAPAGGWPLLVLLEDAHLAMAHVLAHHHAGAPKARLASPGVILAIGYVGPTRREHDFIPDGAGAYLDWLAQAVLPKAVAALPLNARRTLAGHSLGGLLALQACLARPGLFDTYVVSSPSVWWGDGYAASLATATAAQPPAGLDATLCLTVGEFEQALSPDELTWPDREQITAQRQGRAMVDRMTALAQILDTIPGLRLRFSVIAAETHRSVIPRALDLGVRVAFPFVD